ncbi:MAG: hypothetical protein AAB215_04940 [Planctomycetota bacterium]
MPETHSAPGGPIARALLAALRDLLRQKIVSFQDVLEGARKADDLRKSVASDEILSEVPLAHGVYAYVQNQISILAEILSELQALKPLSRACALAEEEYAPEGPPMSPLTRSYFFCWAMLDLAAGEARETFGTCCLPILEETGAHPEFLRIARMLCDSRMGLYVNEGAEGDLVTLREFVTDRRIPAIVAAGHLGKPGEIWLARVLPPPLPGGIEHVVFTTPYGILSPGEKGWNDYFDRTLPAIPAADRKEAYATLMKYGPEPAYWPEYIFQAYVNHRSEVIFLRGYPDVPESRPHAPEGSHDAGFVEKLAEALGARKKRKGARDR